MKTIHLLIVMLCLPTLLAWSQTLESSNYDWNNVKIGCGGYVTGVVFSEKEQNLIYARTDVGGAYRWNSATNQWVQLLNWLGAGESSLRDVESIAADPVDANRVYIAAGEWDITRVLISSDKGATFTKVTPPFKVSGNGNGRGKAERLVIDPNKTNILFYGSRADGLFKSVDSGLNWTKVTSFPADTTSDGVGIPFIVFDKSSATSGNPTQKIYVGRSSKSQKVYRSTDAGQTWQLVSGAPARLKPHDAGIDNAGMLYISFCDGEGPNGIGAGAVYKYNTGSSTWTNITPPTGQGGFGGLAVDKNNSGTIMAATICRWWPGDVVYRSTNGGTSWTDVDTNSDRDASEAPYMYNNGGVKVKIGAGNWIDNMRIDPFNSSRVMYGTGAGIWSSSDISNVTSNTTVHWTFLVKGVEEMGAYGLISPPQGAPLLSVVGDCGGFRHADLTQSPQQGFFTPPGWGTNTSIDFAQNNPNLLVRSYFAGNHGARSTDNGVSWTEFSAFPGGAGTNDDNIFLSANGDIIYWAPEGYPPYYSKNAGATWTASSGVPTGSWYTMRADRVNNNKFYVYNLSTGNIHISTNGGATFTQGGFSKAWGGQIVTNPVVEGDIWIPVYWNDGNGGLYHSTNSGASFTQIANVGNVYSVALGKAGPGKTFPTVYIMGAVNGAWGFYASVDAGTTWTRINDNAHQYGYDGFIIGDERVFGRIYVSTHCMGIVYAQLKTTTPIAVTSVALSPTTLSLNVGSTSTLSATISPANATNQNVTWASGNTSVASVSTSGLVTGLAAGVAQITVTTVDGAKVATCTVTVTAGTGIVSGSTYRLVARHSGKSMGILNASTADNAEADQETYNSLASQQFVVTNLQNGYYRLSPKSSTTRGLQVTTTDDAAKVLQYTYSGTNGQQWELVSMGDGYYQIKSRLSGKCMDVNAVSWADGASIIQWPCGTGYNQQWSFTAVVTQVVTAVTETQERLSTASVFPNPSVDGGFFVDIAAENKVTEISVINMQGVRLFQHTTHQTGITRFDAGLPAGLYMVQVKGKDAVRTKLIVR